MAEQDDNVDAGAARYLRDFVGGRQDSPVTAPARIPRGDFRPVQNTPLPGDEFDAEEAVKSLRAVLTMYMRQTEALEQRVVDLEMLVGQQQAFHGRIRPTEGIGVDDLFDGT